MQGVSEPRHRSASIVMAYVVLAYEVVAYVVVAYAVMTYAVRACIVMTYAVMAFVVMAYAVMTYTVMAYVVMACVVARSCGALTSISCPSRVPTRIASALSWTGAPASFYFFCWPEDFAVQVSPPVRGLSFFPRLRGFERFTFCP